MADKKKDKEIVPGKFWGTQPVPQSYDATSKVDGEGKQIDGDKDPQKDIKQTPYPLPEGFEWYAANIDDPEEVRSVR